MSYLKEYYESVFHVPGMPAFEELPEDYKQSISKTLGFAFYKANTALNEMGKAMDQAIKKWAKPSNAEQ